MHYQFSKGSSRLCIVHIDDFGPVHVYRHVHGGAVDHLCTSGGSFEYVNGVTI